LDKVPLALDAAARENRKSPLTLAGRQTYRARPDCPTMRAGIL
jgi:hypothetical protein